MPDLAKSLQDHDLGHLCIVSKLWGLELNAPDARAGLQQLVPALLDPQLVEEIVEALPVEARTAIEDLQRNGGSMPWTLFTRRYGTLREMGPGKRDREHPYQHPASPTEILWYRALVARAFLDSPTGPQEFAYIPEDLLSLIPIPQTSAETALGRPASPFERANPILASDRILDHACTLLAALRLGFSPEEINAVAVDWNGSPTPVSPYPLQQLLFAAGILDAQGQTQPEPIRAFLEAPRGEALAQLARAWLHSSTFNELRLLPGLRAEGEWQNDPLRARQAILDFLHSLPASTWWSISAFVADVHQAHPDFQRPAGDYDSWFIRDESSNEFLRGFEHWDEVDGALIRYMITGPLHWLGILDLASSGESATSGTATAFRFSEWSANLLGGTPPQGLPVEDDSLLISSDARLRVPRLVPRTTRYQIARISVWEGESVDAYSYRITPASLERARQQGLRMNHLLALLRRHALAVPPSLLKALERWDKRGVEARLERVLVLHLSSPELLAALRNSRAARFLGNPLGPTTVIVKPGAWEKVMGILAEMGYLGEAEIENDRP